MACRSQPERARNSTTCGLDWHLSCSCCEILRAGGSPASGQTAASGAALMLPVPSELRLDQRAAAASGHIPGTNHPTYGVASA